MAILLAKVSFFMNVVMVFWVFVAALLILVVLMQKGRGGGLSGAFGGMGASSLLGTKTGDFLTWVTIGLVSLFLLLGALLVKYYVPEASAGLVDTPAPASAPAGGAQPADTTTPAETGGTETAPVAPATGDSASPQPAPTASPAPADAPTPSTEAGSEPK